MPQKTICDCEESGNITISPKATPAEYAVLIHYTIHIHSKLLLNIKITEINNFFRLS